MASEFSLRFLSLFLCNVVGVIAVMFVVGRKLKQDPSTFVFDLEIDDTITCFACSKYR